MTIFGRFKTNTSGSVATIFGLTVIPVFGFMGAALDYSRATTARTSMQRAVDATALALVRHADQFSDSQLTKCGQDIFGAMFKISSNVSAEAITVTRNGKTIRVAAAGSVQTTLLRILGHKRIDIGTEARVVWGAKKIELALVLDNTGSMGSKNKLQELKKASHNLLTILEKTVTENGAIKVSIVPFNTKVNVGKSQAGASWLAFNASSPDPALRMTSKDWTGCVTDRVETQNLDVRDDGRVEGDPTTLHLASVCGEYFGTSLQTQELAEIRPLTSNFADLRKTVDSMKADGCTNITIGAAWGLDSLSKDGPLGGGAAYGTPDVEKIMILLTDGNNTRSRAYKNPTHCNEGTFVGDQIDQRTRKVCDTIKSENAPGHRIRLYTIRVIEGNAGLLRDCASRGDDGGPLYFDDRAASQLQDVFEGIAAEILQIQVTQ